MGTIFCSPRTPGWLYFEADSAQLVEVWLKGMIGLFWRTCNIVPVNERAPLLLPLRFHPGSNTVATKKPTQMRDANLTENDPDVDPPAKVASSQRIGSYWVQFRGGLHRKDIGLVISEPNSLNTVVVKVVPRIDPETHLGGGGKEAPLGTQSAEGREMATSSTAVRRMHPAFTLRAR